MPGAEVTGPGGDSDPLWCILAPTQCMPSLWAAGLCVCVHACAHVSGLSGWTYSSTFTRDSAVPCCSQQFNLFSLGYFFISSLKLCYKRTNFPVFSLRF